MKILYIITKSNWGGAQRHVFDLALEAKKKGYEVAVALGGEGMLNDRLKAENISTINIASLGRNISIGKDASSLGSLFKIIHKEKPDILHLHSPKAAGLASFIGRLLGVKKIIYTVHGWAFNEDRPFHQKIIIALFSWLTMLFSTHIILLSRRELEQAQMFPIEKNKPRLIPLGMKPPIFMSKEGTRAFLQSKTPEPLEKKIIIGTIAELHPNKGFVYAIDAIEKLAVKFPSILYFIIADGEQKSYLENLIKEKKIEKNIVLAGYVDDAAQYLRGFSIFLLPSVKEGLPYVLIEAGCAGLPVIATTVGGIPEIIDDMKSGVLIQPKKPDEIAHAIEFLIKHHRVGKEYGKNLQDKVREKFSLEKMVVATFALYEEKRDSTDRQTHS